jgi:hypothetical protein
MEKAAAGRLFLYRAGPLPRSKYAVLESKAGLNLGAGARWSL